jgi:hypothetical protein
MKRIVFTALALIGLAGSVWAAAPSITLTTIFGDTNFAGPYVVKSVIKCSDGVKNVLLGHQINNAYGSDPWNWWDWPTPDSSHVDTFYFTIPAIPAGIETPAKIDYVVYAENNATSEWTEDPVYPGYYSFLNTVYTPAFSNVSALRDTFFNGPFVVKTNLTTAYGDSVSNDILNSDTAGGADYPRDSVGADGFYYYTMSRLGGGVQTPVRVNWFLMAYDTMGNWGQHPVNRDTTNWFRIIDPRPSSPSILSNTDQTGPFPVRVTYRAEGGIINDSLWVFTGSSFDPFPRDSVSGNTYFYTIPAQQQAVVNPVTVYWYLKATDSLTGNYTYVPEGAGPPVSEPYSFRIFDWTGPQVSNVTRLENTIQNGPFDVTATCRDTSGVSQVRLYFRAKPSADTSWNYLPMFATGNPDEYLARIPVQNSGHLVQYYLLARDGALNASGGAVWNSSHYPAGGPLTPNHFYTGSPQYKLLLVNDGLAATNYEPYYTSCLDSNGVTFGFWDNRKANVLSQLSNFNTLIWFTGDDSVTTLSTADMDSLMAFLDLGGKLLLSSKNLGQDLLPDTGNAFYKDYLKASLVATNSTNYFLAGQPNRLPLTFGATETLVVGGIGGANNRFSMDKIKPLAGADSVFTFKPSGSSGVVSCSTSTYQTIYCTVPLESMTKDRLGGRMSRTTFIGRCLNWFGIQTFYKVEGEAVAEAGLINDAALLYQAYPNPFSSSTTISFNLPAEGRVSLIVYNVLGQAVRTVCDEQRPAGVHKIAWNGKDESGAKVSNGIYLYRLVANGQSQTKKVVVLR